MNEKTVIVKLDALLNPLGFTRQKTTWNRSSAYVVDVIDVEISKAGDTTTVNAGVLDTAAYMKLWGDTPPTFVEGPMCTIRVRVGELIDGKDLWWQLNDSQVGVKVAQSVADCVLPFIKRMRSRQDMVQWLTDTQVVKKRYPLPIINLAILQNFLGKSLEACALLTEVEKKAVGAWRIRAADVAERLGCAK